MIQFLQQMNGIERSVCMPEGPRVATNDKKFEMRINLMMCGFANIRDLSKL